MRTQKLIKQSVLMAICLLAFTSAANAQASRTWVSGVGDDVNPCSRTAPCKTFAGAISKTADAGEISVLDPAGYGIVTITKPLTINGEGTLASVGNPASSGITINADVTDVIVLRHISINGAGTSTNGIRILSAKSVQIEHCSILRQGSNGIDVAATNSVSVRVNDTLIEDCGLDGIHASTTTGEVLLSLDNVSIQGCGSDGIEADDNVRGSVRHSMISDNASTGIQTSGTNSQLNIESVLVSYSTVGIQASSGSTVRVSNCTIAQNATGVNANSGTLDTHTGNSFMGNTTNGTFSNSIVKL